VNALNDLRLSELIVILDFHMTVFRYVSEVKEALEQLYVHCTIYIKEDREHFSREAQEISFYKIYLKTIQNFGSRGLLMVLEVVTDLTELEDLHLPDNYLEELPTSINKLRNLTLRLDENQLRDLPQAIAELSNLTILSTSNQLPVLPSSN